MERMSSSLLSRTAFFKRRPFKPGHFHNTGHTRGAFRGRKYHHCNQSLPSCQDTRWNSTWNAQSLEQRSSLAYLCVSSGLVFWKGTKRLENHLHTQEGRDESMNELPRHLFLYPHWKSACQVPWKKIPRKNWTKAGGYTNAIFVLPVSRQNKILILQKFFDKSWEYAKVVWACFVDHEKTYDRAPRESFGECCGVRCWRPPVTGRQIPVFLLKS